MDEPDIHVYQVRTPEGVKEYVSLLPPERGFSRGLAAEAIVGGLLRPLAPGEPITPEVFARNRVFVDFLHGVIARNAPDMPGFQAEARRQGDGWVYVVDQRTPTPAGEVPPEDVVGGFQVQGGQVVPGSYRPNPNHRILSQNGFFRLGAELHECLLRELESRA